MNKVQKEIKRSPGLYLTREQIAKALGFCPGRITAFTKMGMPVLYSGKIKECRHGARPRYRLDWCQRWLNEHFTKKGSSR